MWRSSALLHDYIQTVKLLARTFGPGDDFDRWLTDAIAPIVAKLRQRQTERDVLLGEIGAAESMRTLTVDRQVVERKVLAKVANWKSLLARGIAERRQFLREVLDGPIYFKPEGDAYRFTGTDRRGREISDLVGGTTFCGVPTGSWIGLTQDRFLSSQERCSYGGGRRRNGSRNRPLGRDHARNRGCGGSIARPGRRHTLRAERRVYSRRSATTFNRVERNSCA